MSLPLEPYTVIDLTRARSGPTCVRQLADMGAKVIQIWAREDTGGDFPRRGFDSLNLHRNKRSMTLDLKSPRGIEILKRLVARADVVVENFRPDVKHRLGIDYDTLSKLNPRLIYGSISGFGQTGPYRDRPGYDQIAQGVLGALIERERSGKGQWVHTSLLEAMVTMLDFQAARWLIDGTIPPQAGNDHPTGIPTGVFKTSDGHINIAASGQHMFRRLCETLGTETLLDDARFKTAPDRSKNRAPLAAELDKAFVTKTSAEWVELLNAKGVPCGPIFNVKETFENEQVQHLGLATTVKHRELGEMRIQRPPVTLSRTPSSVRTAAPDIGEHTEEILGELGFSQADIDTLRRDKVV